MLEGAAGQDSALADILESVQELKYYRSAVFVPLPGPSTEQAIALSAAVSDGASGLPDDAVEVAD